jgi:hypothetical protein
MIHHTTWPFNQSPYRHTPLSTNLISKIRFRTSPTAKFLLGFRSIYALTVLYTWHRSWRDPTSLFFATDHGYTPRYSRVRRAEVDRYIDRMTWRHADQFFKTDMRNRSQALCLVF